MRIKNRSAISFVLLSSIFLIASCGNRSGNSSSSPGPENPARPAVAVIAEEIIPRKLSNYIVLGGEIEPAAALEAYSETTGRIIEIRAGLGDRVEKDEVLAMVDPSRPGQRFAPNPVRAPISGVVTQIPVQEGSQISMQSPIARIATTSDLKITAYVAERFAGSLRRGQRAVIRLSAYPEEGFPARIAQIAPVVDSQTRTIKITLTFNSRDARPRAGMFAVIDLVLEERENALTIPQGALIRRREGTFIYIVDPDNRAELRQVKTGIEIDGTVELFSGVNPGDRVITRGQNLLEPGTEVRIVTPRERDS